MHCLVVGYGSIGKRHANVLEDLNCQVSLVTAQQIDKYRCFTNLEEALAAENFQYVVIANATHLHRNTLANLISANFSGKILVEKPLFSTWENIPTTLNVPVYVAYNMRFNELLIQAKKLISNEEIVTFTSYVGQYLPTWRKNSDYREGYSAKKAFGGGVLRDLSHELDYSIWFCGPCKSLTAKGGKYSELEIDSDDVYTVLMENTLCPMTTLHLNYLDRKSRRDVVINTKTKTITIDLINGLLHANNELILSAPDAATQSYYQQHSAFLNDDLDFTCHYSDGLYVMKLIDLIEKSSNTKTWVTL